MVKKSCSAAYVPPLFSVDVDGDDVTFQSKLAFVAAVPVSFAVVDEAFICFPFLTDDGCPVIAEANLSAICLGFDFLVAAVGRCDFIVAFPSVTFFAISTGLVGRT